jgi:hypothetical protein
MRLFQVVHVNKTLQEDSSHTDVNVKKYQTSEVIGFAVHK